MDKLNRIFNIANLDIALKKGYNNVDELIHKDSVIRDCLEERLASLECERALELEKANEELEFNIRMKRKEEINNYYNAEDKKVREEFEEIGDKKRRRINKDILTAVKVGVVGVGAGAGACAVKYVAKPVVENITKSKRLSNTSEEVIESVIEDNLYNEYIE